MKKRLLIIIILQLIILFILATPRGDINFDGKTDLLDLTELRQILLKQGDK